MIARLTIDKSQIRDSGSEIEMVFTLYDLIGTAGVVLIVLAYALVQTERLRPDRPVYSVLNALGAALVLISLGFDFNFPAFVVEFFWLLISLYGLGRYFMRRKQIRTQNSELR